jgi:hypothetical protein
MIATNGYLAIIETSTWLPISCDCGIGISHRQSKVFHKLLWPFNIVGILGFWRFPDAGHQIHSVCMLSSQA